MIASLSGTVVALEAGSLVLEVSGVGFQVLVSASTSRSLTLGSSANLHTSLIVREDGFTLFGFSTVTEQRVFDLLRSVTGVGPKSALAILGDLSVDQIIDAVAHENDAAFRSVSGIGPKTAKLISVTLAGKLGASSSSSKGSAGADISEVISALTGLGWNDRTAIEAANRAQKQLGSNAKVNDLLKFALSNLAAAKSVGTTDE